MDNRVISTRDLPPSLLPAARLVGFTPPIISTLDSRVCYSLYTPSEHYNPSPPTSWLNDSLPQTANVIPTAGQSSRRVGKPPPIQQHPDTNQASDHAEDCASPLLPVIVAVHGTTRQTTPLLSAFSALADEQGCAVVAPLFPAGVDGVNDWDSYKSLRAGSDMDGEGADSADDTTRKGRLQADAALLDILDSDIPGRWPGLSTERIILQGFSGGASFAQRFALLYPDRVHAVSIAAPGSLTRLGGDKAWPAGVAGAKHIFGKSVDKQQISRIKEWQLLVGSNDAALEGSLEGLAKISEGWQSDPGRDWVEEAKKQMRPRKELLEEFRRELGAIGVDAEVDVVPGGTHSFKDIAPATIVFLRKALVAIKSNARD
ncbi:MAG: hypothetical protein MMC23_004097 [Stictis urceolatum]|nr:hypothetical protein [Stictis urceolata]